MMAEDRDSVKRLLRIIERAEAEVQTWRERCQHLERENDWLRAELEWVEMSDRPPVPSLAEMGREAPGVFEQEGE